MFHHGGKMIYQGRKRPLTEVKWYQGRKGHITAGKWDQGEK